MLRPEWFWRWRMKRFVRPLLDERDANETRVAASPEVWTGWWEHHGRRELRCILMTAWDPIGTGDAAEAWDEYDSYEAGVATRLRDIADPAEAARSVAEYLAHIEDDYIGLGVGDDDRRNVADCLVAWYEWSFVRGGRPPAEWAE